MRAIDQPGLCQFAPKGLDWQDLSGGALDVATYLIYVLRIFFSHNTWSYIDPQVVASFDPRGLIGRICEGDY